MTKIKSTIFFITILSLILGGLLSPSGFSSAQSYTAGFSGYIQPWGNPGGTQSSMEASVNLPYNGRYEVRTYYSANSGQGQLYEEYKVLVGGRYIGQTTDPNRTAHGPDYQTEYLGEHDFTKGSHNVRLEHRWNYSEVGYQSVHPQNVTFTLKEIFKPTLSISKSVDKSTAQKGDILAYILSFQNTGSDSASNVVITDDYDENYLDVYDAGGGTVSGGKISWNIGTFGADSSGTRLFKVRVKDNLSIGTTYIYNKAIITSTQTDPTESNIVSTKITISNNPPVADAGPDKEVYEDDSVVLDGSGSDPDSDPLSYSWSCTGGYLSNRYISRPTFTAPQVSYDRYYTCTLTVSDDKGLTDSDSMEVKVFDRTFSLSVETNPASNIQINQATLNGYLQDMGGTGSCNVWFQWGRTTSYGNETPHYSKSYTGSFNYIISGLSPDTIYHFRAVAQNNEGIAYGQDRTFITSQGNNPPYADAGPDKEVSEEYSITISGSGSDPDGDPITYRWSCSGGSLSNQYTAQPSFTAPQVSYDRYYTCTLTVTDDRGLSDSDSMRVKVKDKVPANVSLDVEKSLKNVSKGDTKWYYSYRSADPLDKLLFKIVVKSTGDAKAEDVTVKDTLPANIIYQGNLEIDGVYNGRNISTGAINIGDLSPGKSKTITFEAKVASEGNFSYGTTELINTARAYNEKTSDTDTFTIKVVRKAVAGAVTTIPTGITDSILGSILLPLGIALLVVWLFRSKLVGFDKWTEERKKEIDEYRAKKTLKRKISQLKSREYFKE